MIEQMANPWQTVNQFIGNSNFLVPTGWSGTAGGGVNDAVNESGFDDDSSLGTILMREGSTYDIWIIYPNNLNAAMLQMTLIPGYHFLAGSLVRCVTVAGSQEMQKAIVIQCLRKRIVANKVSRVPTIGPNTAVVQAGGQGFQVGDIIAIPGGFGDPSYAMLPLAGQPAVPNIQVVGRPMIIQVTEVFIGEIVDFTVVTPGQYILPPSNPAQGVALTGVGYDCYFTMTINPVVDIQYQNVRYQLYDYQGVNGGNMNALYTTVANQMENSPIGE
jgi:hypothetical protein